MLPNTGPISLVEIQTEFGGETPIGLNEYYAGGAYVPPTVSGIPASGAIDMSSFLGKSRFQPYDFTSHTFTAAGATGNTGPTLAALRTAYGSAAWTQANANLDMTTQGIQRWRVPRNGRYQLVAAGAKGGNANTVVGGSGRIVSGTYTLYANEIISILVGQQGVQVYNGGTGAGGTGGGGTFVVRSADNAPIVIGGGGGGARQYSSYNPATAGWDGNAGVQGRSRTGGTNTVTPGTGGNPNPDGITGGGGGLNANGTKAPSLTTDTSFGTAFVNGGVGGTQVYNDVTYSGGFGGAAAFYANSSVVYAGGGGGYTGGDSANYQGGQAGGGGGSYYATDGASATPSYGGLNAADGYVTISAVTVITEEIISSNSYYLVTAEKTLVGSGKAYQIMFTNLGVARLVTSGGTELWRWTPTWFSTPANNQLINTRCTGGSGWSLGLVGPSTYYVYNRSGTQVATGAYEGFAIVNYPVAPGSWVIYTSSYDGSRNIYSINLIDGPSGTVGSTPVKIYSNGETVLASTTTETRIYPYP